MQPAERRRGGQPAVASVRRGNRRVWLVRSEEGALNPLDHLRRDLFTIVNAGIAAADAGRLVVRALASRAELQALDRRAVTLVAAGKAAVPMAAAFVRHVPVDAGLVVSTHASLPLPAPFESYLGGHPVPNAASERAARRALELATSSARMLVVLLSGGASALLAVPLVGISLDDKRSTTSTLLAAGADIEALNVVRKHLSAIKGGRLAAAAPGPTLAMAVSDVMGDDLTVIGSGPTVADPTTFLDALSVVDRFGGRAAYPPAVVRLLEAGVAGTIRETPKPGDSSMARARTILIGSRRDALEGARRAAAQAGYVPMVIDEAITGEARQVAPAWVERMAAMADASVPVAVISSGETTVRVTGNGKGGRNQEFALAAAPVLARSAVPCVLASVGSDGVDGPTDAAGAVADHTTLRRIAQRGLSAADALANNDTYTLFARLGDLVTIGPTETNVGDLQILLMTPVGEATS